MADHLFRRMTTDMTAEQAEKYVRERWENARLYTSGVYEHDLVYSVRPSANVGEWVTSKSKAWLAAAEYTRAHEQKIAEKREEIRFLREDVSYNTHVDAEKIIRRIRAVLEAQLAELLLGWRQK